MSKEAPQECDIFHPFDSSYKTSKPGAADHDLKVYDMVIRQKE